MSKITEKNFNLDDVIAGLDEICNYKVQAGPSAKDKDAHILLYAGANEFGAVITSRKAIARLYYEMVKAGLLDPKKVSIFQWMKSKKKIVIPERSFLRSTADDPKTIEFISSRAQDAMNRFIAGEIPAIEVINSIGIALVDSIKKKMRSNIQPANHPLTIVLKGFGKNTLYADGRLQNSIQFEVVHA